MALPSITFTGNLTADPELRFTQSGKPVTNFNVACNERKKNDQGEWVDGDTTYLRVVVWRAAETVANGLSKGSKVTVTGTLVQSNYETATGEKRNSFEVRADDVAKVLYDKASQAPTAAPSTTADGWTGTVTEDTPF